MKLIALDGLHVPGAIACSARSVRGACDLLDTIAEPFVLVGGALAYHAAARSRRPIALVTTRLARRRWRFVEPHRFTVCPVLLAPTAGDADIAESRRLFERLAVTKRMIVLPHADALAAAIEPFLSLASSARTDSAACARPCRHRARGPASYDRAGAPAATTSSTSDSRGRAGRA